jgi:hypothetical protein
MKQYILLFFFVSVAAKILDAKEKIVFNYHYPEKTLEELENDKNFDSIKCLDAKYIGITKKSLEQFLVEYGEAVRLKKFQVESSDCDDFALFFKFLSSFYNTRKENNKYALCVGFAIVDSKKEALGTVPSAAHAVNVIWSDIGWIVVEPQNGNYCQIKDYPNEIKWVLF